MQADRTHQPDPPSVRQLLENVASGDKKAFAELVLQYKEAVIAAARQVLPDERQAKSSAKATFLNVNRLLTEGARPDDFLQWLTWIAKNDALALSGRYSEPHTGENRVYHLDDLRIEPDPEDEPGEEYAPDTEEKPERLPSHALPQEDSDGDEYSAEPMPDAADVCEPARKKARRATDIPEGSFLFSSDDEPGPKRRRRTAGFVFSLVLIGLLIIVFLWITLGLMRSNSIPGLPDLGFSWFNASVYRLF